MEPTTNTMTQWEDLVLPKTPEAAEAPLPQTLIQAVPTRKLDQEALPASYLTHELRAPITSIRLGLEILQEQASDRLEADERQMLNLAVKNTGRLEGLVNDIMDYSKIMAGKMQMEKEPCDARELAGEAVDGMQAVAVSHGVKLIREESEPLPRVSAEGRRIVQILTNLISNAVKFTPARGTVTVSVKRGEHEHAGTLVFRVKDTGRGIPAKDLPKIFDMFQSSGKVKQTEGTGLGLTMARMMVELHGGRIWAESWRQMGASFYFSIPIESADLSKKVEVYPKPVEYTGLLVDIARGFNAVLAMFI
ncbi:MAG: HAMP domain-containing histidine kinase [Elusimicrobia bacterium]|nr:HAMP domain-containing histidine kinase [Elusimicrobiota bacterium]